MTTRACGEVQLSDDGEGTARVRAYGCCDCTNDARAVAVRSFVGVVAVCVLAAARVQWRRWWRCLERERARCGSPEIDGDAGTNRAQKPRSHARSTPRLHSLRHSLHGDADGAERENRCLLALCLKQTPAAPRPGLAAAPRPRARHARRAIATAHAAAAHFTMLPRLLTLGAIILFASHLQLAHTAICNDESTSCSNWAKQGECPKEGAGLDSLCPVSCGTCTKPLTCNETEEDCEGWAKAGECENNPKLMLKKCPISCGICSVVSRNDGKHHDLKGPCVDRKFQCPQWAAANACNENARFMATECPASCEICKPSCIDLHPDCPGWAASGECITNPLFLLKTCSKSCNVCGDPTESASVGSASTPGSSGSRPTCLDHNVTQCHIWADTGQCTTNPGAVFKDCPQTCGACSSACTDHDDRCRSWALAGNCDEEGDHPFMLRVCPATCGVCAKLDRQARPPDHGEL